MNFGYLAGLYHFLLLIWNYIVILILFIFLWISNWITQRERYSIHFLLCQDNDSFLAFIFLIDFITNGNSTYLKANYSFLYTNLTFDLKRLSHLLKFSLNSSNTTTYINYKDLIQRKHPSNSCFMHIKISRLLFYG